MADIDRAKIVLYSNPISDCSARLRIALNIKAVPYKTVTVDLDKQETYVDEYTKLNPAQTIPTLVIYPSHTQDEEQPTVIAQSIAALEYIEEMFPDPPLLPPRNDPKARMIVRTLVETIATDIHPLTTHRVSRELTSYLPDTDKDKPLISCRAWSVHWITRGLAVYEKLVAQTAGQYSFGDTVTLADVVLIPELWTAKNYGVDLAEYPTINKIFAILNEVRAIKDAH